MTVSLRSKSREEEKGCQSERRWSIKRRNISVILWGTTSAYHLSPSEHHTSIYKRIEQWGKKRISWFTYLNNWLDQNNTNKIIIVMKMSKSGLIKVNKEEYLQHCFFCLQVEYSKLARPHREKTGQFLQVSNRCPFPNLSGFDLNLFFLIISI